MLNLVNKKNVILATCLVVLIACNGGSKGQNNSNPQPQPSLSTIEVAYNPEVIASIGGVISVPVSVSAPDSQYKNFKIGALNLKDGWSSSVNDFACNYVTSNNNCHFELKFEPTALAPATTLAIPYSYQDMACNDYTGTISIKYQVVKGANITSQILEALPISAKLGEQKGVNILLEVDDATKELSDLKFENLDALPPGWQVTAGNSSCAKISLDSPCQLELSYTPSALEYDKQVQLFFNFKDDYGSTKRGYVNITYNGIQQTYLIAKVFYSAMPTIIGKISAARLHLASNDGSKINALKVLNTSSFPAAGKIDSINCDANGNCDLIFSYQPTVLENGTARIDYSYLNSSNTLVYDSVNINYSSTPELAPWEEPRPAAKTILVDMPTFKEHVTSGNDSFK